MIRRHSSRWLDGWIAYDQVEPFGQRREDYIMGTLIATVANSAGKIYKDFLYPENFISDLAELPDETRKKDPKVQNKNLEEFFLAMGAVDLRDKSKKT